MVHGDLLNGQFFEIGFEIAIKSNRGKCKLIQIECENTAFMAFTVQHQWSHLTRVAESNWTKLLLMHYFLFLAIDSGSESDVSRGLAA